MAVYWRRQASATGRAVTLALVAVSVGITAVLTCAGEGSLLYNTRDGFARWLDWIAPAVNLAYALPSLFQGGVATAWAQSRDVVRRARCRMVWAPNPRTPIRLVLPGRAARRDCGGVSRRERRLDRSRGTRRSSQDRARSRCCAPPAAAIGRSFVSRRSRGRCRDVTTRPLACGTQTAGRWRPVVRCGQVVTCRQAAIGCFSTPGSTSRAR